MCSQYKNATRKITAKPCMKSATCCGMESSRSDVCNQSEGKIHVARDAIRLRRLHTRSREITYQSFGLDRKKQVFRLAFSWLPLLGSNHATKFLQARIRSFSQKNVRPEAGCALRLGPNMEKMKKKTRGFASSYLFVFPS